MRKWRYGAPAEAVVLSQDGRRAFMGYANGVAILCDIRLPERRRRVAARTSLTRDAGCWWLAARLSRQL